MSKRATITDIAKAAGVSVGTVSHVLNGNTQRVGAETRERVLAVMRTLDYRPSAIARSMARRRTATIGLVVSDIVNSVHAEVMQGVEEVASAAGFQIILTSAPTIEAEQQAIQTMRAQQVAGCIFLLYSQPHPSLHLSQLREGGMPLVVINRHLRDRAISQVLLDDHGAGVTATEHLLGLGHTRIATLAGPLGGPEAPRSATERHAGWLQALAERGIRPPPEWVLDGGYSAAQSYQAVRQFLARPWAEGQRPTALFASNFTMATAALKALHEAGARIPADLAIVSVDDPPQAAYTYPALTSLSLPVAEAGRIAARTLLGWVAGGEQPCAQHISLGFTLHVRESCGGA